MLFPHLLSETLWNDDGKDNDNDNNDIDDNNDKMFLGLAGFCKFRRIVLPTRTSYANTFFLQNLCLNYKRRYPVQFGFQLFYDFLDAQFFLPVYGSAGHSVLAKSTAQAHLYHPIQTVQFDPRSSLQKQVVFFSPQPKLAQKANSNVKVEELSCADQSQSDFWHSADSVGKNTR